MLNRCWRNALATNAKCWLCFISFFVTYIHGLFCISVGNQPSKDLINTDIQSPKSSNLHHYQIINSYEAYVHGKTPTHINTTYAIKKFKNLIPRKSGQSFYIIQHYSLMQKSLQKKKYLLGILSTDVEKWAWEVSTWKIFVWSSSTVTFISVLNDCTIRSELYLKCLTLITVWKIVQKAYFTRFIGPYR